MGTVGGTLKHLVHMDRTDPVRNQAIISEKLFKSVEFMSISGDLREAFLRYYLSGIWVSSFVEEKISLNWKVYESWKRTKQLGCLEVEKYFLPSCDDEIFVYSSLSALLGKNSDVNALLLVTAVTCFLKSTSFVEWLALAEADSNYKCIAESLQEFGRSCSLKASSKPSNLSSSCEEDDSDEKTITSRFSIVGPEYSTMRHSPSETTVSYSSMSQLFLAKSEARSINGDRLQSLIMNQLANTKCADIYQLLSNANGLWLRQTLRSFLEVPYAVSIASILPSYHDEIGLKSSKKDIGRFFPIVYVNKAYEQMVQFSYSDIQGSSINSLFSSCISGDHSIELFEENLINMRRLQMHMSLESRSGEIVHTLLATFPVYNPVVEACTHVIVMYKPIPASCLSFPVDAEREPMRQLLCLLAAALV
jgi:hypothetical protein